MCDGNVVFVQISERDRLKLPLWMTDQPPMYWEGGMPDVSGHRWRPDLIDILTQKGPGGIPRDKETEIQRLLAEKVDPCDHHFRWIKGAIKSGPRHLLGN